MNRENNTVFRLRYAKVWVMLAAILYLSSCSESDYYNPMQYECGKGVFTSMGPELLMIILAALFIAHIVISIIVSKKKDKTPTPVATVCKLEISRMVIFALMGSIEVVVMTNYWFFNEFFWGHMNWLNTGGMIFVIVLGLYQLFSCGQVYTTVATRESDTTFIKIMIYSTLVAIYFGIFKSIMIAMGTANWDHDLILDNLIVKLAMWVIFIALAILVVLMVVRTGNILGALLSVVCIVPYIFGTVFCAVSGGLVVFILSIAVGVLFSFMLQSLFSPTVTVLSDGTQLTGVTSDMITGAASSGKDSYGNVWDYIGGGQWQKRN